MGLMMIAASLAVISVVITLLFLYEKDAREQQIRAQGVRLVRLLSGMSVPLLEAKGEAKGVLGVLQQSQNDPDFAYAVIVDRDGRPLNEITREGTIVPPAPPPRNPSAWLGERHLTVAGSGRTLTEFHAPLLMNGRLGGFIRLGYYAPGYRMLVQRLPFFASLALPVFLLAPLFYFLVRREIRPLHLANREMERFLQQGTFALPDMATSGEIGDFMGSFTRFVRMMQARVEELESRHSGLLTSTKVLSFRRARIEAVLHAMPDALAVLDESGTVSFVNARLPALLGKPQSEILGHTPREWCVIPKVVAFLSRYEAAGAGGVATDTVEFTPPHAGDKTLSVSAHPLFAGESRASSIGTLVLFRDITEENAGKHAHAEFIAQVAHELKTPLNTLKMYSEALMGPEGASEGFRVEGLNVIHDETDRLALLISNLLSLTRFELGGLEMKRQRVRLHELLADAFENIAQSGRDKGLHFHIDVPREMSPVFIDKELLRIAVNNLLTNAIKYNRPGGRVELTAEEHDDAIRISVKDTGIGMTPDEQDKIFDKFYRAENAQVRDKPGHGLGLPLVQQIVYLHHGELEVRSERDAGSEFIITLRKDTGILKKAV